jgi:hypothetical protein
MAKNLKLQKSSNFYNFIMNPKLFIMNLLTIGLLQFVLILLVLLFPVVALISVFRNKFQGNEKLIWILLIIFLPILGAILYFVFGRGKRVKK